MECKGISKLDLKRRNRRQILLAIRNAGMLARVDIAAQLSLTRAAVTIITNQMIAQGILEDMNTPILPPPDAPKKKGRRKTMIRINPNYKFVLGAVIEEEFVSVGLSNLADEVLGKAKLALSEKTTSEEIIQFIISSCRAIIDKSSLKNDALLGLGVGIVQQHWKLVGCVISENGAVSFDALRQKLYAALGIPVYCGNAVGLYALANMNYTDPNRRCQMLMYSGTSFQMAFVQDGELLGGLNSDSASVDYIIVLPGGRKAKGYPDGSVHAEVTADAVVRKTAEKTGRHMTITEISDAYNAGDKEIIAVTNSCLDLLATMIFNFCATYRVSRIIFQCHRFHENVLEYLKKKIASLSSQSAKVAIDRSTIVGDKSFIAGCRLVIEKQFYDLGGLQMQTAEE